ncbi:MAG: hypothetical protein ABIJ34_01110 [archaeon]
MTSRNLGHIQKIQDFERIVFPTPFFVGDVTTLPQDGYSVVTNWDRAQFVNFSVPEETKGWFVFNDGCYDRQVAIGEPVSPNNKSIIKLEKGGKYSFAIYTTQKYAPVLRSGKARLAHPSSHLWNPIQQSELPVFSSLLDLLVSDWKKITDGNEVRDRLWDAFNYITHVNTLGRDITINTGTGLVRHYAHHSIEVGGAEFFDYTMGGTTAFRNKDHLLQELRFYEGIFDHAIEQAQFPGTETNYAALDDLIKSLAAPEREIIPSELKQGGTYLITNWLGDSHLGTVISIIQENQNVNVRLRDLVYIERDYGFGKSYNPKSCVDIPTGEHALKSTVYEVGQDGATIISQAKELLSIHHLSLKSLDALEDWRAFEAGVFHTYAGSNIRRNLIDIKRHPVDNASIYHW